MAIRNNYQVDNLIATDIDAYLKQHENKEMLRFLTCGHVDDGKSTLIGRLLFDSKIIYDDQLAAVTKDSAKSGTTGDDIDLALLVDGLQAEREQGITIDVAYRYFSTTKRKFIIADTPGHEQYTRNMATGASTCDLAIILIDARQGVQTQTRRHSYIASLLGINHIIVAVNKMDLINYSEDTYNAICDEYQIIADKLNMTDVHFVPLSALNGDNIVHKSSNMIWYQGDPLLYLLETVDISPTVNSKDVRFPVQYVNRPDADFRGYCGTLASGVLHAGDNITVLPAGTNSTIKALINYDGKLGKAIAGDALTITLENEIDISRGDMIVSSPNLPYVASQFTANVVWMADTPLTTGKRYRFKIGVNDSLGELISINSKTDITTFSSHHADKLQLNEIGHCTFSLNKTVVFDNYQQNRQTGAFIIIDRLSNATIGAGMIIKAKKEAAKKLVISKKKRAAFEADLDKLINKHFPDLDKGDLFWLLENGK